MLHTRRAVLTAIGAGALAPLADAVEVCREASEPGWSRCEVDIDLNVFQTARQRCENWCWAACAQTLFALQGYDIDQQDFVERVYSNRNACLAANVLQASYAIEGIWTDRAGRRCRASTSLVSQGTLAVRGFTASFGSVLGATPIVNRLKAGQALMIGARQPGAGLGHAMVLTGLGYDTHIHMEPGFGGGVGLLKTDHYITRISVRDPWPDNPNRRTLTAEERAGAMFVLGVSVLPA